MEKGTKNDVNLRKLLERLPLAQKVDYAVLEEKLGVSGDKHNSDGLDRYIQAIREHLERKILPREIILAIVCRDIEYRDATRSASHIHSIYGVEKIYQTFKRELDEYNEKLMK